MNTHDLPDWLRDHTRELEQSIELSMPPPDPRFPTTPEARQLRQHNLECLFERILDKVTEGGVARDAVETDHNKFTLGEVMRWIRQSPDRLKRYREAQEIGAEIVADDMIRIADGDGLEDVQRSKLRIDTRKTIIATNNKERFGQDPAPSNPFSGGVTIVIGEVTPNQPTLVQHSPNLIEQSSDE